MKRAAYSVLICMILGLLAASWIAPKTISWYFEPPVEIGVNCRPATEWALQRYQYAQIGGLILGAVAGLFVYLAFFKGKGKSEKNPLPPTSVNQKSV